MVSSQIFKSQSKSEWHGVYHQPSARDLNTCWHMASYCGAVEAVLRDITIRWGRSSRSRALAEPLETRKMRSLGGRRRPLQV